MVNKESYAGFLFQCYSSPYAASVPDADAIELARVEQKARVDGLRAVLRDRPPAPCCDSLEDAPCLGCSDALTIPGADEHMTPEELADLAELNATNPAGAIESDLARYPSYLGWPSIMDNWRWTETPADEPEPRIPLAELVDIEVERFRARGNDAGDLLADHLAELARIVRVVSASRPDQVEARLEVLEQDFTEHAAAWEMPEPEMTAGGRIA